VAVRSLSTVFGTPTILRPSCDRRLAAARVPSPPMAMRASTPNDSRVDLMLAAPPLGPSNGFVREVPRMVPPCLEIPRTLSLGSSSTSPFTTPRHPSWNPTKVWPWALMPLSTAPRMTAFSPGQILAPAVTAWPSGTFQTPRSDACLPLWWPRPCLLWQG
jgi:hypothetical protein